MTWLPWLLTLTLPIQTQTRTPERSPGEAEAESAPEPGPRNALGTELQPCSLEPRTGWTRDGSCRTDERDRGVHVVCAQVTDDFLRFSREQGNDLITPRGSFPGLQAGDRWCLCAGRWDEARRAGVAPPVVLESTHAKALRLLGRERLEAAAASRVEPAPPPDS